MEESKNNIDKIILKRGRAKKVVEKKETATIRGRKPESKLKYIVERNGNIQNYKTISEISKAYGIADSTVYNVLKNKIKIENFTVKKIE